jgi:small multidrug resistance pump
MILTQVSRKFYGVQFMAWALLFAAIVLEVCGTTCMKLSAGFTKLAPSLLLFVFYVAAFTCLTYAIKTIDVSVAYAIWAGLGTALIAVIGTWYFSESMTPLKIGCIVLIIVGVVGLNLQESHGPRAAEAIAGQ